MILTALALVARLDSENFGNFVKEEQQFPLMVILKSRWCGTCREIEADWQKIRDKYSESQKLVVADISCDSDNNLCKMFPGQGTPRVFWVTDGTESAKYYTAAYSYTEFENYIERKIEDRVKDLYSELEFREVLTANVSESLLFLRESTSTVLYALMHTLSVTYERGPVRFFRLMYDVGETKLTYRFEPTSLVEEYNGEMTENAVKLWIEERVIPPVTEATRFFVSRMVKEKQFLMYYENGAAYMENMTRITKTLPRNIRTGIANCTKYRKICSLFGIRPYLGSQIVLARAPENIYYKFRGKFNDDEVTRWMQLALAGKDTALGPGSGYAGFLSNMKSEATTFAFWKRAGIVTGVVSFSVFIVVNSWRWIVKWTNADNQSVEVQSIPGPIKHKPD